VAFGIALAVSVVGPTHLQTCTDTVIYECMYAYSPYTCSWTMSHTTVHGVFLSDTIPLFSEYNKKKCKIVIFVRQEN
jgi:hypothetical protein